MSIAFITGVTGQDGSYLAESLVAQGWTVHGLVREGTTGEQPVPEQVVAHVGDLLDPPTITSAIKNVRPDAVFHLAGLTSVAESWKNPLGAATITALPTAHLLELCWQLQQEEARDVRYVQASSSEIFGSSLDDPQTESTAIKPNSPYGAAKAYAHHLVGVYRQRGLPASSAILYNHESPRRPPTFVTRKITLGVAAIAAGRADHIELGNLDARRDWGWAPDYVEAMRLMAESTTPQDYIVATGETHSVRDFVTAAFARIGVTDPDAYIRINPEWNRPTDAPSMRGGSRLIREHLGWRPTMGFADLVSTMVDHDLTEVARS